MTPTEKLIKAMADLKPSADGKYDVNGFHRCPLCGDVKNVRLQTPLEDDNLIRRVYVRCFGCFECIGPTTNLPRPMTQAEVGAWPVAEYREVWNRYAEEQVAPAAPTPGASGG